MYDLTEKADAIIKTKTLISCEDIEKYYISLILMRIPMYQRYITEKTIDWLLENGYIVYVGEDTVE